MEIPPDLSLQGFLVGTSGYYYDDWVGIFNPPRIRARYNTPRQSGNVSTQTDLLPLSDEERADQDRLVFYQKYFSFVEINNTFYREPAIEHFLDIERRSKPSMHYSVKTHKNLSHDSTGNMELGRELMRKHVHAVSPLIETGRFYSFLVQLPDYAYRTTKKLDYILASAHEAVRMGAAVHVEFRHKSWHDIRVLQQLKDSGVGVCNTEIPLPDQGFPLKAYATSDKGYIRYSGLNYAQWFPEQKPISAWDKLAARNARYNYEYSDEELKERMKGQIALMNKTSVVAVAFNNHFQAKAVKNAIKNLKMLKEALHNFKDPPFAVIIL